MHIKIISGGQTGVDRIALDAALDFRSTVWWLVSRGSNGRRWKNSRQVSFNYFSREWLSKAD
ncbi:putative molybdenum carrier protein [Acinetobacter sp. 5862]|uniref:putative molybdenum carrier protein n=1 Tax=Acinetobacter sp. 5862 TaxID=2967169 RepID=UPI0021113462|nr:putative molybdenum carrier protein [Acinetobacter sp. 5862]